jgi:hypothetical protein
MPPNIGEDIVDARKQVSCLQNLQKGLRSARLAAKLMKRDVDRFAGA